MVQTIQATVNDTICSGNKNKKHREQYSKWGEVRKKGMGKREPLRFYSGYRQNDFFEGLITFFDTRIHSGHEPVHQRLQCTTYFRFVRFAAKYDSFEDIALSRYPCLPSSSSA